ncbi:MAG: DUF721 domain-containing protein [Candidatus Cloacimonetes bacterium]|nr:DUF721 domain-containing protein [Candidatus Cloacimonadota bacterium]
MSLRKAGGLTRDVLFQMAGEEHRAAVEAALAWRRLVGEPLARRSYVYQLDHETLLVGVENNVWMQELVLLKHDLMQRLNKLPGVRIRDIRFFLRQGWQMS